VIVISRSSHFTPAPSASLTKRSGTMVLPFTVRGAASSFRAAAPTFTFALPSCSQIVVLPFFAVIVRSDARQTTLAPSF